MVIVVIFSLLIFIFFFNTWYRKQSERLIIDKDYQPPMMLTIISGLGQVQRGRGRENGNIVPGANQTMQRLTPSVQEIPQGSFTKQEDRYPLQFLSFISRGRINIVYQAGKYFIRKSMGDKVKLLEITGFMYAQSELAQLLFLWGVCFIAIVYLISLYFVSSSLKHLKKLTTYIHHLNLERPMVPLKIRGHKDDEIKMISEAINNLLKKIQDQMQTLKDFIAHAAHELKTPLMVISSEVDLALKKKDYKDKLLQIQSETNRISNLLETLLFITRLENTSQLETKQVNLYHMLQDVVKEIEDKYQKNNIKLYVKKTDTVQAHPRFLEIISKNLIENAYKHAGENIQITVTTTKDGLTVSDTGKGIAPEIQDKIFERFRQLEKTEEH
jgi:signal transduction histidine kinase